MSDVKSFANSLLCRLPSPKTLINRFRLVTRNPLGALTEKWVFFFFSADKGHKPTNNLKVMGSRPVESHSLLFVNEYMMNDAIHRKRYALNGILR